VATTAGFVCIAATARGIVAAELLTIPDAFAEHLRRRLGRSIRWIDPDDAGVAGAVTEPDDEADAARHLRAAAAVLEAAPDGGDVHDGGDGDAGAALASLPIDLEDRPAWDRAVLGAVRAIPRGEVRSYGEIARAIGRPGAARAVGGAVGRNPVGLLVPCHRVVAGNGTLGGYGGGWWGDRERLLDLKAELLAREGISLPRRTPRSRGR
jgi:O-6-methylguanine DNA methyltransferase